MADYYPKELLDKRLADFGAARDLTIRIAQSGIDAVTARVAKIRARAAATVSVYTDHIDATERWYQTIYGDPLPAGIAARVDARLARLTGIRDALVQEAEARVDKVMEGQTVFMDKIAAAHAKYDEIEEAATARHLAWKAAEEARLLEEARREAERAEREAEQKRKANEQWQGWVADAEADLATRRAELQTANDNLAGTDSNDAQALQEAQDAVAAATAAVASAENWLQQNRNGYDAFLVDNPQFAPESPENSGG